MKWTRFICNLSLHGPLKKLCHYKCIKVHATQVAYKPFPKSDTVIASGCSTSNYVILMTITH